MTGVQTCALPISLDVKLHIADVCDLSSFLEGCLPKLITICVFGNPVEKSELAEEIGRASCRERV